MKFEVRQSVTSETLERRRPGRIHLGRVSSSHGTDYWELRVQWLCNCQVFTVRMTPEQFTDLMSGAIALDVELETLEPPQDPAELRAEVEELAVDAYGDDGLTEVTVSVEEYTNGWEVGVGVGGRFDQHIQIDLENDERTALLMLRGALRARLGR